MKRWGTINLKRKKETSNAKSLQIVNPTALKSGSFEKLFLFWGYDVIACSFVSSRLQSFAIISVLKGFPTTLMIFTRQVPIQNEQ